MQLKALSYAIGRALVGAGAVAVLCGTLPLAGNAQQAAGGAAWELVLFEADGSQVTQRIVFRPVGWLRNAQLAELVSALGEAEAVRTRWGE